MPEDLGERTEDATPKRRQEARTEGNVARSQDLSSAVLLLAGTLVVSAAAMWMLGQARIVIANVLDGGTTGNPLLPAAAWETARYVGGGAIRIAAPVLLVAWLAALAGQFGQIGWVMSPRSLQPRLGKLNPVDGFQRIFGLSGLVKALLDSVKVILVVAVGVLTVRQHADQILLMPYLPLMASLGTAGGLLLDLALRLLAVLLVLGVLDYAYQRWKHGQDLRMTKQQVKDEMKQTEGDPDVKRRRLRIQQQIAMQRISAAVPRADVVVTNPEHVAVAIGYDRQTMSAPAIVAKGADHLALRIRQIALKHGIPVVERKPLARALYKDVAVGQEIPPDFYAAVAELLAYVYRLSEKRAG